jgi:hypothetical protein
MVSRNLVNGVSFALSRMQASQPLVSFMLGDGGVIGLPHRTHELHEDRTPPPILENGYGTGHMSHMFEGEVGG